MSEENDDIIPFREDMTYDLARDTLRIERRHLHCVQVVLQSDSPGERTASGEECVHRRCCHGT